MTSPDIRIRLGSNKRKKNGYSVSRSQHSSFTSKVLIKCLGGIKTPLGWENKENHDTGVKAPHMRQRKEGILFREPDLSRLLKQLPSSGTPLNRIFWDFTVLIRWAFQHIPCPFHAGPLSYLIETTSPSGRFTDYRRPIL